MIIMFDSFIKICKFIQRKLRAITKKYLKKIKKEENPKRKKNMKQKFNFCAIVWHIVFYNVCIAIAIFLVLLCVFFSIIIYRFCWHFLVNKQNIYMSNDFSLSFFHSFFSSNWNFGVNCVHPFDSFINVHIEKIIIQQKFKWCVSFVCFF